MRCPDPCSVPTRGGRRIEGKVPDSIRDDIEFLRANVYLAQEKPADSFEVLKRLQGSDSYGGFAAYNLGVALLPACASGGSSESAPATTPAPSLCGITRGYGMPTPNVSWRFLTSPGI